MGLLLVLIFRAFQNQPTLLPYYIQELHRVCAITNVSIDIKPLGPEIGKKSTS